MSNAFTNWKIKFLFELRIRLLKVSVTDVTCKKIIRFDNVWKYITCPVIKKRW